MNLILKMLNIFFVSPEKNHDIYNIFNWFHNVVESDLAWVLFSIKLEWN